VGYNTVQYVKKQSVFLRKVSPPSSGSKNKPMKLPVGKQVASRASILLGLFFYPEDGVDMFLQNVA
jgi:hypothetical protein